MNTVYLISHENNAYTFVKRILKQEFNTTVTEIVFNPHGKPYFKDLNNFYFNISHSHNLQAVAVGDCEVGIDIEKLRYADLRVAKRFTAKEQEYILKQDCDRRFFEVWTKKEAYLKYKGTGISGGLSSFNVFDIPETVKTFVVRDYIISVCSKKEFKLEVVK